MNEFCAGVKILLERMKSNPEDFELIDINVTTTTRIEGRFYDFGKSMEQMILGDKDAPRDWQYFTEEERQALVAGFKEMKRDKFDKHVMERVFDERYVERQRERVQEQFQPIFQSLGRQQAPLQMQQGTFIGTTNTTPGGLMNAIGLGGVFK